MIIMKSGFEVDVAAMQRAVQELPLGSLVEIDQLREWFWHLIDNQLFEWLRAQFELAPHICQSGDGCQLFFTYGDFQVCLERLAREDQAYSEL